MSNLPLDNGNPNKPGTCSTVFELQRGFDPLLEQGLTGMITGELQHMSRLTGGGQDVAPEPAVRIDLPTS